MQVWEAGDRRYELVEGWGELPDGWEWGQVAGVTVDSEDNVHVFTRTAHPYMVFNSAGKLIDHWGEGLLGTAHGVCIGADDSIFFTEHLNHIIHKFDKHGKHQMTLGTRGKPSDTGFTKEEREPAWDDSILNGELGSRTESWSTTNGVAHAGGPFHRPTDLKVAPDGNIFISDGYNNSRVHKFDANGNLLQSWGEPGDARDLRNTKDKPGYFHTPHGIAVHGDRVYVCDRENNRIQIFTQDGTYVDMWLNFLRPTGIYLDDAEKVMYVSELDDRVSIIDLEGNVIGHLGYGHVIGESDKGRSHAPGEFYGPHTLWKDTQESIYVGEVLEGQRLQKFARKQ